MVLFGGVFVWLWYQGDVDLIEWAWKYFLFLFFLKEFKKDSSLNVAEFNHEII